jgi:hypothetical protein
MHIVQFVNNSIVQQAPPQILTLGYVLPYPHRLDDMWTESHSLLQILQIGNVLSTVALLQQYYSDIQWRRL